MPQNEANLPDQNYMDQARTLVYTYAKNKLDKSDGHLNIQFGLDDVYIVWFCKTLQNWKCLLSSTLPDGMYYEVTYNGDKDEFYLDAYKKFENVKIANGSELFRIS